MAHLTFAYFIVYTFYLKYDKQFLTQQLHAETFGVKYTDVCSFLWNVSKIKWIVRRIDRGVDWHICDNANRANANSIWIFTIKSLSTFFVWAKIFVIKFWSKIRMGHQCTLLYCSLSLLIFLAKYIRILDTLVCYNLV